MAVREIVGLFTAVVVLAGVSVALASKNSQLVPALQASSSGFSSIISTATGQGFGGFNS